MRAGADPAAPADRKGRPRVIARGRPVSAPTRVAKLRTTMTSRPWPAALPVRSVRIARPTDQLDEVVRFYRDGLGLPEIGRFDGHAGYRGVLLGLPGTQYHLELTQQDRSSPGHAPSRDNLLVLYLGNPAQAKQAA